MFRYIHFKNGRRIDIYRLYLTIPIKYFKLYRRNQIHISRNKNTFDISGKILIYIKLNHTC